MFLHPLYKSSSIFSENFVYNLSFIVICIRALPIFRPVLSRKMYGGMYMSNLEKYSLNSKHVADATYKLLEQRGITTRDIAELVHYLQEKYSPSLSVEDCIVHVEAVLSKREVQNAILTGIQLD